MSAGIGSVGDGVGEGHLARKLEAPDGQNTGGHIHATPPLLGVPMVWADTERARDGSKQEMARDGSEEAIAAEQTGVNDQGVDGGLESKAAYRTAALPLHSAIQPVRASQLCPAQRLDHEGDEEHTMQEEGNACLTRCAPTCVCACVCVCVCVSLCVCARRRGDGASSNIGGASEAAAPQSLRP